MFVVWLSLLLSFFLIVLLKVVSMFISEFVLLSREELSSYECGFEHHSLSRVPFSLRYFFLTLIFLLFDLEVILLLFFPFVILSFWTVFSFILIFLFIFILFLGLVYEWVDGGLEWVM